MQNISAKTYISFSVLLINLDVCTRIHIVVIMHHCVYFALQAVTFPMF